MYGAVLVALLAAFCWPDRNIADVPFSELTLKMIGGAIFSLWLGYHALMLAFASIEKDSFWPWRWTRRIIAILAIRAVLLAGLGYGLVELAASRRWAPVVTEHLILVLMLLFVLVTLIVCIDDDELVGPNFLRKNNPSS